MKSDDPRRPCQGCKEYGMVLKIARSARGDNDTIAVLELEEK